MGLLFFTVARAIWHCGPPFLSCLIEDSIMGPGSENFFGLSQLSSHAILMGSIRCH
jgi:hypothetical protein